MRLLLLVEARHNAAGESILSQPSADSSLCGGSLLEVASADARRWTEPVWQLSDRPRHPFGPLTFELVSYPTLAGRGGSVSRRDHNPKTRNRTTSHGRASPKEESSLFPAALREGARGRGFSQRSRLPRKLPQLNLWKFEICCGRIGSFKREVCFLLIERPVAMSLFIFTEGERNS